MSDLQAQKAWLHEWADRHDLYVTFNGTIGFGRPCVGMTNGESYVALGDVDIDHFDIAPMAYHKDDYLAVLFHEDSPDSHEEAIRQLYAWVKRLDEAGVGVGERPVEEHSFMRLMYPFPTHIPVLTAAKPSEVKAQ